MNHVNHADSPVNTIDVQLRGPESSQMHFFPCKRCFEYKETGHLGREYPKKKKEMSNVPREEAKTNHINTCTFCLKRGHTEFRCWTKQRTLREDQIRKRAKTDPKKLEAKALRVEEFDLAHLSFQDLMVHCLLDSGANCSIVCEKIAKQANCKIEPYFTTVHGLGSGLVTVIGWTVATIQAENATAEIKFLVVPDAAMIYDVILGEDILDYEDLCVKKVDGEKKLLHFLLRHRVEKETRLTLQYYQNATAGH
ncbi:hypothetical protein ANTPLA_LOCUS8970 [Anthophora plagiata]